MEFTTYALDTYYDSPVQNCQLTLEVLREMLKIKKNLIK